MGKQRTVRLEKFRKQIAESVIGPEGLVRIEFGGGEEDYVTVKIPVMLSEGDDFPERLNAATNSDDPDREIALVILSGNPELSAESLLDRWLNTGLSIKELATIYGAERRRVEEALGNFRYRP